MISWLILIFSTILMVWVFGKVSRWATAVSAVVGLGLLAVGLMTENLRLGLFGGGLMVFSGLINFAFNGSEW